MASKCRLSRRLWPKSAAMTWSPGLQVMADDFTTSSTLRGLEWDAAQVRLKERWSAKVHVECEGVSALQAFLVVLCESSAE